MLTRGLRFPGRDPDNGRDRVECVTAQFPLPGPSNRRHVAAGAVLLAETIGVALAVAGLVAGAGAFAAGLAIVVASEAARAALP